jgi:hypothetical protein
MVSKFLAKGFASVEFYNLLKLKDHFEFLQIPNLKNFRSKLTICLKIDDFLNSQKKQTAETEI